jgi:DNA-directed RNA polymerase subunit F
LEPGKKLNELEKAT